MDRDKLLTHLFEAETPYSPPLDESDVQERAPLQKPAAFTPVKVPSGSGILQGQLLQEGELPLDQRGGRALLIRTDESTLVHISPDGMVVTKQGNDKRVHGKLVPYESSLSLEKKGSFIFTIRHGRMPRVLVYGTVQEALLYDPPTSQSIRRRIHSPQTNIYSLLLRQFQG